MSKGCNALLFFQSVKTIKGEFRVIHYLSVGKRESNKGVHSF